MLRRLPLGGGQTLLLIKAGALGMILLQSREGGRLLWQGGLRMGEVEELRLDDLNLADQRLILDLLWNVGENNQ